MHKQGHLYSDGKKIRGALNGKKTRCVLFLSFLIFEEIYET